jgi:hypothetical protein
MFDNKIKEELDNKLLTEIRNGEMEEKDEPNHYPVDK